MIYIYILRSRRLQRYYVGSAEVIEKRLQEHNAGKSRSTHAGVPWELIHTECFATRSEAVRQEQKSKPGESGVIFLISGRDELASAWRLGAKVPGSHPTPGTALLVPAPRQLTDPKGVEPFRVFLV